MFSMPNTALAETCEADNSVFNMPILLAVALIGATVGGKVLWDSLYSYTSMRSMFLIIRAWRVEVHFVARCFVEMSYICCISSSVIW